MGMIWAVSNHPLNFEKDFSFFIHKGFYFYASKKGFFKKFGTSFRIAIDGFVLPRFENFDRFKHLDSHELVYSLFKKNGSAFIHHIKGVFNLILITDSSVEIYNDRNSIKKSFIYRNDGISIISNNLKIISRNVLLNISRKNAAVFSIMEHFIDGMTLFDEVVYSKPATRLLLKDKIKIEYYWMADNLISGEIKDVKYSDFALKWKTIIRQYIEFLKPNDLTMTLTGGNDTRMILSALLNLGIKPHTFTFGNPESADGVIAQKISHAIGLEYHNYFIKRPSSEWFTAYADIIIPQGNSLINIHRAHRLDAIEKEIENNPGIEMIFGGFMGGDYIKGIIYDDYITARLVRLWEFDKREHHKLVREELDNKYFDFHETDIEELISYFEKLKFFSADKRVERQFQYIFNVIGAIHDVQDINIFGLKIKYTVNPFMDIDFLEMIFSSQFGMLNKKNDSFGIFKRLMYPGLYCHTINLLCDDLSNIEFSKKGYYSPKEYLGNKWLYILKRLYRYYKSFGFPANFPYGEWIKNYSVNELKKPHPVINKMFQIQKLKERLDRSTHHFTEGYWHQFTNIINLNKIANYYLNG